jgi:hypothetical protein
VCVALALVTPHRAAAEDWDAVRASKRATAVRISQPIRLDGILDDAAWELAHQAGGFYHERSERC